MTKWQEFNNREFTNRILGKYSEQLKSRIPRARFMLDGGDDTTAVSDAISSGHLRVIGKYSEISLPLIMDQYIRNDETVDVDSLSEQASNALSESVIAAAQLEEKEEGEQVWVLHKAFKMPVVPDGSAIVHIASNGEIELLGQLWYDTEALKNRFEARTTWALARTGGGLDVRIP
jgi:hypothetical protein